jgi:hypothetical protein
MKAVYFFAAFNCAVLMCLACPIEGLGSIIIIIIKNLRFAGKQESGGL